MRRTRILALLVVALTVTACGKTGITDQPEAPPEPTEAITLTEVSFTDAAGNTLVFPQPPTRIVVAGRAGQLILHALYLFPEAGDRIVAMEQRLQREVSMLPLIDPDFDDKKQFERDAAAEQIAPMTPDVVLMKTYMVEQLGEPLNQIGIPVALMDLESPEQFFQDLAAIGAMFNNPTRVDEIYEFYNARLHELQEIVSGEDSTDRPDVLLLQYSDRSGEIAFNVPSSSWLQTTMVRNAGGNPVWVEAAKGGGWTVVNFEQIAAWDADVIIIVNYFGDPGEVVKNLEGDANWNALRATANGQLYAFPGDFLSWDQPDTRWILGQMWLAKIFYPDLFADWDILKEARDFYSELYNINSPVFEAEILPLMNGDIEPEV